MTLQKTPLRVLLVVSLVALGASLFPMASGAVTKAQVDQACANSRAQLADYRAAQGAFEEAAFAYEEVLNDVEFLERRQERIQGDFDSKNEELGDVQSQLEEQAVQMYMMGGFNNPGIIFSASSVDEVMTTNEFLSSATLGGQQSIDDIVAFKGELSRYQDLLQENHDELKVKEAEAQNLLNQQEAAMVAEREAYDKLEGECKQLTAQYDREQAELRAAAARRASGSVQVGHFICPMTPGRTSFIDSWGFPRSGGRTHKGVDMFAAKGEPVYAVQSGRASASSNSLGGVTVHIRADTGHTYYYAHLDSRTFSGSIRVEQGDTIGYNGNSGNARTTSPHLHFEIRPGGGSPVNPYPTVRAACY